MKDKPFYFGKTIWAGAVIIAYGVLDAFGVSLPTELILTLASALGLIGVRQAIAKNN